MLRWVPGSATPAQAGSGDDTIEFGLGINIQDIVFTMSGNDLVLAVSQENSELTSAVAAADTITIRDWNGARPISKMAFYQTGTIDVGTGTGGTKIVAGTDGNDFLDRRRRRRVDDGRGRWRHDDRQRRRRHPQRQ